MPDKLSKYNKSGDEITRHAFVSNMESFIRNLLSGKINSQTNDYLLSHGIDAQRALSLLLNKPIKDDPSSAVLSRKESIKTDKETGKDRFYIKYTLNSRQNLEQKLRNIYIKLFEYHIVDGNSMLNEEGICDAGDIQIDVPFIATEFSVGKKADDSKKKNERPHDEMMRREYYHVGIAESKESKNMKKTVIISEEQMNYLMEMGCCDAGGYAFDVPFSPRKKDPSMNHRDIFRKSRKK